MIDAIIKGAIAIGAGVAAWYADKIVKEKTGKHIHEHAIDFVKSLWNRLKNWAQQYLSEHEDVRKVYLSVMSIIAAKKRAMNDRMNTVKVKLFGQTNVGSRSKVISDTEIPLDQYDGVIEQAKADPVLAMRY